MPDQSSNLVESGTPADKVQYFATIHPGNGQPLHEELGRTLAELQKSLGLPLWILSQCDDVPSAQIDVTMFEAFRAAADDLLPGKPVALVINSPGGVARYAYQTARLLQRRCGHFTAIIPKAAWSAATLLVLGASSILMGPEAALGPLDAQVWDEDTEDFTSALNEVQALEQLRAYALESIDEAMFLLLARTGKKVEVLLPHVLRFVTESTRPLLEKIDIVHYNERARTLKVAEEYARRLLNSNLPERDAQRIAKHFVEKYPEHGFPIDREEVAKIGLPVAEASSEQSEIIEKLWDSLCKTTVVGQFKEISIHEEK